MVQVRHSWLTDATVDRGELGRRLYSGLVDPPAPYRQLGPDTPIVLARPMFGTHGETHGKNVHASAHDLAQVILDVMDGRQLAHMAFDWDSAILGTSRILCKAFGPGYYFMHSYGGQGCNIPEMYPFVVQAMEDAAVRQMGLLRESGRYGEGPQAMLIVTHRPLAATFVQEWTKRVYGEQPAITRLHMGEAYAHLPESHSWVKLPEGSLEWHASRPMDPGERR